MKAIFSFLLTLLTFLLLGVTLAFALPMLLGFRPYAIVSGSMEPFYPVGSLVFSRSAEPEEIQVGDCIVFRSGGETGVHRVVEIDREAKTFTTKGDANVIADPPVPFASLIGRISAFALPWLGYISIFVRSNFGQGAIAAGCLAALVSGAVWAGRKWKKYREGKVYANEAKADG